jgi:hypothetical protein
MDEREKIQSLMDIYLVTRKLSESTQRVREIGNYSYLILNENGIIFMSLSVQNDGSYYVHSSRYEIMQIMRQWTCDNLNNDEIRYDGGHINFLSFNDFERFFNEIVIAKVALM